METQPQKGFNARDRNNRLLAGFFIVVVGIMLLLRETGVNFPEWMFSWQVFLIVLGVYVGIKHAFRGAGWMILILVGAVNLIDNVDPALNFRRYSIPLLVIAVGLFMLMRPKKSPYCRKYPRNRFRDQSNWRHPGMIQLDEANANASAQTDNADVNPGDFMEVNSVFGAARRVVVSKNFQGGECHCFMGGAELDLTQADIKGTVMIVVNQVLGGTKITVPSNWEVKTEVSAVFGGIEDKRQVSGVAVDPEKVLLIRGSSVFGGIDISNY